MCNRDNIFFSADNTYADSVSPAIFSQTFKFILRLSVRDLNGIVKVKFFVLENLDLRFWISSVRRSIEESEQASLKRAK